MPLSVLTPAAAKALDVVEARRHVRQDLTSDDLELLAGVSATTGFAESECNRTLVATRYRLTLDSFPGYNQSSVPWGKVYGHPPNAILLERGPVLGVRSVKYLDMSSTQQTEPAANYTVDTTGPFGRVMPIFGRIWQPTLPQIGAVEVIYDAGYAAAITANATTDILTIKGGIWQTLTVNDVVRLSNSGGALPAPLQPDTDYYIKTLPTATSFTLSATAGGTQIDLTDTGSGTSYIGVVPEAIKSWMKLRMGGLYVMREDSLVLSRGQLTPLPYIDRMLDPYRAVLA